MPHRQSLQDKFQTMDNSYTFVCLCLVSPRREKINEKLSQSKKSGTLGEMPSSKRTVWHSMACFVLRDPNTVKKSFRGFGVGYQGILVQYGRSLVESQQQSYLLSYTKRSVPKHI
jgi:hypothetical protein